MPKKSGLKTSGDFGKFVKKKYDSFMNKGTKYPCPKCKESITLIPGKNKCPHCDSEIDFN